MRLADGQQSAVDQLVVAGVGLQTVEERVVAKLAGRAYQPQVVVELAVDRSKTYAVSGDVKAPCVVAGPTCDSVDVLYEKTPYDLPVSLSIGDKVLFEACGAYTTTYSTVGFNGFPPLASVVI